MEKQISKFSAVAQLGLVIPIFGKYSAINRNSKVKFEHAITLLLQENKFSNQGENG